MTDRTLPRRTLLRALGAGVVASTALVAAPAHAAAPDWTPAPDRAPVPAAPDSRRPARSHHTLIGVL